MCIACTLYAGCVSVICSAAAAGTFYAVNLLTTATAVQSNNTQSYNVPFVALPHRVTMACMRYHHPTSTATTTRDTQANTSTHNASRTASQTRVRTSSWPNKLSWGAASAKQPSDSRGRQRLGAVAVPHVTQDVRHGSLPGVDDAHPLYEGLLLVLQVHQAQETLEAGGEL